MSLYLPDPAGDQGQALWKIYQRESHWSVARLRNWTIDKHEDWLDAWEFLGGDFASREEAYRWAVAHSSPSEEEDDSE